MSRTPPANPKVHIHVPYSEFKSYEAFLRNAEDVRNVVAGVVNGKPVFVSNVAEVTDGGGEQRDDGAADDQVGEAILGEIQERVGHSTRPGELVEGRATARCGWPGYFRVRGGERGPRFRS